MKRTLPFFFSLLACTSGKDKDSSGDTPHGHDTVPADTAPDSDTAEDTEVEVFGQLEVLTHAEGATRGGTILFGLSYGNRDDEFRARVLEINRAGEIIWWYDLPEEINPFGTGLMDVELTAADTLLLSISGSGIHEVDRDGNIVWSHRDISASHDSDRLENGNTLYVRSWTSRGEKQAIEVDPDGQEVWSWLGMDYFSGPTYSSFSDEGGAWMHPNAIQRIPDGQTLIGARNFNSFVTVNQDGSVADDFRLQSDGSDRTLPAEGPVDGDSPHDVRIVGKGAYFTFTSRSPHRVLRFDRTKNEPAGGWLPDLDAEPNHVGLRSALLIGEGSWLIATRSRIVEVNRDREIVWEVAAPLHPLQVQGADNEKDQQALDELLLLYNIIWVSDDGDIVGQ